VSINSRWSVLIQLGRVTAPLPGNPGPAGAPEPRASAGGRRTSGRQARMAGDRPLHAPHPHPPPTRSSRGLGRRGTVASHVEDNLGPLKSTIPKRQLEQGRIPSSAVD
jgi:hypothetical protein